MHLVAPPLMWSEVRSTLHLLAFHGELPASTATEAAARLESAPVRVESPPPLGPEAWRIADELGWARTCDAEYVALASLLGCRLVTLDGRLWRGARRLGFVVSPAEL
jgi:predicted nucleic acid-binding protein